MHFLRNLWQQFKGISGYAKFSIKLGFGVMLCFYIVAAVAVILASTAVDPSRAMVVYRGALESAPASLVAGVGAGLLCDLIIASHFHGGDSSGED